MSPEEISKLNAYLKKLFENDTIAVKKRPKVTDSVEVYIKDEFIGLISRDEDDEDEDDISYNFTMAILDFDLE